MSERDPIHDLASQLLADELEAQPQEIQARLRYAWARVALDYGILILIGQEHADGADRLICALQDDGSCYVVERPPGWSLQEEAQYVARFKAMLGGPASP